MNKRILFFYLLTWLGACSPTPYATPELPVKSKKATPRKKVRRRQKKSTSKRSFVLPSILGTSLISAGLIYFSFRRQKKIYERKIQDLKTQLKNLNASSSKNSSSKDSKSNAPEKLELKNESLKKENNLYKKLRNKNQKLNEQLDQVKAENKRLRRKILENSDEKGLHSELPSRQDIVNEFNDLYKSTHALILDSIRINCTKIEDSETISFLYEVFTTSNQATQKYIDNFCGADESGKLLFGETVKFDEEESKKFFKTKMKQLLACSCKTFWNSKKEEIKKKVFSILENKQVYKEIKNEECKKLLATYIEKSIVVCIYIYFQEEVKLQEKSKKKFDCVNEFKELCLKKSDYELTRITEDIFLLQGPALLYKKKNDYVQATKWMFYASNNFKKKLEELDESGSEE